MCGRYVSPESAIERHWHLGRNLTDPFAVRYNVSPTAMVPVLRRSSREPGLELALAPWSFVPHWWKQPKPPAMSINARNEGSQLVEALPA